MLSDFSSGGIKKKSILKKGDSSGNQSKEEIERLLPDQQHHTTSLQHPSFLISSSPSTFQHPSGSLTLIQPTIAVTNSNISDSIKIRPTLKQIGSSKICRHAQPQFGVNAGQFASHSAPQRLIGAVTPIQLHMADKAEASEDGGLSLVRCSNPKCLYNRVTHSTPLCAGCGSRMETLANKSGIPSKPHSLPLSPISAPEVKEEVISRQSSNESAPPAC